MIQSTIGDYANSDYKELVEAVSDSKKLLDTVSDLKRDSGSYPKVATYTINENFPQKLFNNWFVPKIIQGKIYPIDQLVT